MAANLSPEYLSSLRRMTGQQKLRTSFAMYWAARKLKAAAIRQKHPEWSEAQVTEKVKDIFLHACG
jgi:hypothetical protein